MAIFIKTLDDLKEQVRLDVLHQYMEYSRPMKLRILAQRYGRLARRFEVPVASLVADETLFFIRETKLGGRLILPRPEFTSDFPHRKEQDTFWEAYGGAGTF